jgi:uncharacterized protein (DUF302 family)
MGSVKRWNLIWGLSGAVVGAGITFTTMIMLVHGATIIERESPYDFATTVQTISANAANRGWTVSRVQGVHAAIAVGELQGMPIEVLELCHPSLACRMLRSDNRSCLAMMPCSVAVYERDGKVYVASLNRGFIGRFYRESANVIHNVREEERQILSLSLPRYQ